jgi:hypothetical protein
MLFYVESADELKIAFDQLKVGSAFVHVFYDERIHPTKTSPSVIFIHHIENGVTFVLGVSHPDVVSVDIGVLEILPKLECTKYILNKKEVGHFLDTDGFIDIGFDIYTKTLEQVDVRMPQYADIRSVPIMRLNKSFNDTLKFIKEYIGTSDPETHKFENEFSSQLRSMESTGIFVDRNVFNLGDDKLIDKNGYVFCQYNMFTPTSRPSNRFSKINFAALNKKKGERDCFVSRFGRSGGIVMIDYESYHLRLFGNHVGFELPTSSLHEYLGKFYHDKETLTEDEYELSKKITFNLIFGGISDDIRDAIPFMGEIVKYVKATWDKYNKDGYVQTWYYDRKLRKSAYADLNSYKLFNYLLQSAETERNCLMMKLISEFFSKKKSELFLYHYDAFIFDMHKSEFKCVEELANILSEGGNFPLRVYVGSNYGDLREIHV